MPRLDVYLVEQGIVTLVIKQLMIDAGQITVDGRVCTNKLEDNRSKCLVSQISRPMCREVHKLAHALRHFSISLE